MATTNENRGYTLALLSRKTGAVVQKTIFKTDGTLCSISQL
ncbi:Uncharacterised protein [Moellerella wisconsensis]|nr:Uncharacterised protein [Moellerella wisconsensis]